MDSCFHCAPRAASAPLLTTAATSDHIIPRTGWRGRGSRNPKDGSPDCRGTSPGPGAGPLPSFRGALLVLATRTLPVAAGVPCGFRWGASRPASPQPIDKLPPRFPAWCWIPCSAAVAAATPPRRPAGTWGRRRSASSVCGRRLSMLASFAGCASAGRSPRATAPRLGPGTCRTRSIRRPARPRSGWG